MGAAQFSTYKLIRDLWPQKSIVELLYDGSPFVGLVKKDTGFGEKIRYVGVGTAAPQGIASGFGNAKQYKSPSKAQEFQVQTTSYYGTFSLEGQLYRRFKYTGNKALIVDPMARESKNLLTQMKNDLSSFIHGNGGGALGRLTSGSTVGSQTITLDKGADLRRIEQGMALWLSSADGTSGSIKSGFVTVASVGGTASAPTITVDQATWTAGIPTAAASDYIFRAGAVGAAAGGDGIMNGMDAWCPSHSGSPGTFLGVNRNLNPFKLAGQVLDGTKLSPRQRIMRASKFQADVGGSSGKKVYLMSTTNWENLYYELSSANMLCMMKAPAAPVGSLKTGVEYEAINVVGAGGAITVVADPWCPDNVERLLNMDHWTLASTGELIHWDDDATPDSPMLEDSADAREIRAVSDHALICDAPWFQVRVSVST